MDKFSSSWAPREFSRPESRQHVFLSGSCYRFQDLWWQLVVFNGSKWINYSNWCAEGSCFFVTLTFRVLLGLKSQRILDFLSWPCNCLGCWSETGKLWEPSAKNQLQCQNPELHIWGVLFQHPSKPPKWINIFLPWTWLLVAHQAHGMEACWLPSQWWCSPRTRYQLEHHTLEVPDQ